MTDKTMQEDCLHAWPNMGDINSPCMKCGKTWHEVEIIPSMNKILTEAHKKLRANEIQHGNTIDQRDHAETMADQLAQKIAEFTGEDIGEHSNLNCPWQNALDIDLSTKYTRAPSPVTVDVGPAKEPEFNESDSAYVKGHKRGFQCGWNDCREASTNPSLTAVAERGEVFNFTSEVAVFKEALWEHLKEKLGRDLDAHETYIFHECVNLTDGRRTAPRDELEGVLSKAQKLANHIRSLDSGSRDAETIQAMIEALKQKIEEMK